MKQAPYFVVVLFTAALPVLARQPEGKTPYQLLHADWKQEIRKLEEASPALSAIELRHKRHQINTQFTPRFVAIAEANLDDENVWLYCLLWGSRYGTPGQSLDKLFDLLANNIDKVRYRAVLLVGAMDDMPSTSSDRVGPTLAMIASKHASEYVRGNALFTLACRTKRIAETRGDPVGCSEAEKLLQRVTLEYPKIRNGNGLLSASAARLVEDLRSPVAITKMAPNISGVTISGDPIRIKDYKGRVTLLSFSAHWCAPCVAMHSVQKKLQETFPADQLRIIEINADEINSLEAVQEKMKADGLNWVVIVDGQERAITKAWRVDAHPTYCVVDLDGRIRYRGVGAIGDQLADWVEALVRDEE
ncbi:Thiol-disulfide oxidoreductase ResA [Thalassoglobus neptunius]|uniref:Thiol-disulfide oxidoreductase ResA n=1 Tax=Thalassoglobus neptunius TaxID=1938619 RepID=A0A5C5UXZ5_9PLAN|nr:TlpA disulfide reductase family protein [Thalassoglobus neptunius]TWT30520.1 Thiol-disulfide oxidoreductase ResA [Thalassoglobus neptunius]